MRILALFFCLFWQTAWSAEWDEAGWRALLHFEGSRSTVAPGHFFLSPNGHENAEAEWMATLQFFQEKPAEAACRYPARALYLKRLGHSILEPNCEKFQKWRAAIEPKGLELVFAAAYINSPSSMYGHTLLKFPRAGKTEGQELLDYTLNFGAETGDAGGATYVWRGLTGGFPGYFSTAPFYLKVKEYNYVENRDFWIYPLRLTPEELELLLRHAWELREVQFPYFFLRKNCAYFLLEFLEVARPGQGLTKNFPFWAVPMDTIRLLQAGAWLGEPKLRPSRYKMLQSRRALLTKNETAALSDLLEQNKIPALQPERAALVLDAAYELLRFHTEGKIVTVAAKELEKSILLERAKYPEAKQEFLYQEKSPEQGHKTGRASFSYGKNRLRDFAEFSYRGTLHDLLSDPLGYEDYSELSMGDLRFRKEGKRFFLERADILRLRSLSPWEPWIPKRSWSFKSGFARAKELDCADWKCLYGNLQGGMGASVKLGPVLFFSLAELDLQLGGVFQKDFRLLAGASLGISTPLWPKARLLAEAEPRWRLLGDKRTPRSYRVGLAQSLGKWEIRLSAEKNRALRETLLGAYFYF
jgi:hypothetical protein